MIGHLVSMLTMLKGLPLAYNRDLQEDKEGLFDASRQLDAMLEVSAGLVATATFNAERMREAAAEGYTNATDVADYLVCKGVPFLEAHASAGGLVKLCLDRGISLEELSLEDFQSVDKRIGDDVYGHLSLDACIEARDLPGGTATAQVERSLAAARSWLDSLQHS
jgi:argininosuccinate lyase